MSEQIITIYKYSKIDTEEDWGLLEIIPSNKITIEEPKKLNLPFVKVEEEVEEIVEEKKIKLIPKTQGKRRYLMKKY